MKNAGKDLATAHFTKNMQDWEICKFSFFSIKFVFTLKHFYNKSGNNVGHLISPFSNLKFYLFPLLEQKHAKFSGPFNAASIVEETGPEMVFFLAWDQLRTPLSLPK